MPQLFFLVATWALLQSNSQHLLPTCNGLFLEATKEQILNKFGKPNSVEHFRFQNHYTGDFEDGECLRYSGVTFFITNYGFPGKKYTLNKIEIVASSYSVLHGVKPGISLVSATKLLQPLYGSAESDEPSKMIWFNFLFKGNHAGLVELSHSNKLVTKITIRMNDD